MQNPIIIRYCFITLVFIAFLLPVQALAESSELGEAGAHPPSTNLETTRSYLTQQLLRLPNAVDEFFGDERIDEESNKSRFKIGLGATFSEGGNISYDTLLHAKIVLPRTEERLRLTLESAPTIGKPITEEDDPGETSPGKAVSESEQAATIQAIINETDTWQFKTSLGVKLHTPLDPFIRLRGRKLYSLGEWQLRGTQSFFVFHSTGPGETTQLDFETPLASQFLFRSSTSGTWWHDLQEFHWSQNFSFYKQINRNQALLYRLGIFGNDKPDWHTTLYLLETRFRQRMFKEWMFFEINPELRFHKEHNFHLEPFIAFRIEAILGDFDKDDPDPF